ncbi:hypothetical protein HDV05_004794 [Chytridiales sp. JEL 0842]|nr:hypothetical protein HDV05_004794 [Chytridiales sp. JEL 0842]
MSFKSYSLKSETNSEETLDGKSEIDSNKKGRTIWQNLKKIGKNKNVETNYGDLPLAVVKQSNAASKKQIPTAREFILPPISQTTHAKRTRAEDLIALGLKRDPEHLKEAQKAKDHQNYLRSRERRLRATFYKADLMAKVRQAVDACWVTGPTVADMERSGTIKAMVLNAYGRVRPVYKVRLLRCVGDWGMEGLVRLRAKRVRDAEQARLAGGVGVAVGEGDGERRPRGRPPGSKTRRARAGVVAGGASGDGHGGGEAAGGVGARPSLSTFSTFPYLMFIHPIARPFVFPDSMTMSHAVLTTHATTFKRLYLTIYPDKLGPRTEEVVNGLAAWAPGATHGDVVASVDAWRRLSTSQRRNELGAVAPFITDTVVLPQETMHAV